MVRGTFNKRKSPGGEVSPLDGRLQKALGAIVQLAPFQTDTVRATTPSRPNITGATVKAKAAQTKLPINRL